MYHIETDMYHIETDMYLDPRSVRCARAGMYAATASSPKVCTSYGTAPAAAAAARRTGFLYGT